MPRNEDDEKTSRAFGISNEEVGSTSGEEISNNTRFKGKSNSTCGKCSKRLVLNSAIQCILCGLKHHIKCFSTLPRTKTSYYINICSICLTTILPFSNLYDNEFHEALLEFQHTKHDLNMLLSFPDKFKEDMFNYSCRESSDTLKDIDPDLNNLSLNSKDICKYYLPSQLTFKHANQFSIFHINIRSIRNNFKKLKLLLDIMEDSYDIIAIGETWIAEGDPTDDYNIEGYRSIFQNRQNRDRGGVCIYIKESSYNFKHMKSLSYIDIYNHILTVKLIPVSRQDRHKSKTTDRIKLMTVCLSITRL